MTPIAKMPSTMFAWTNGRRPLTLPAIPWMTMRTHTVVCATLWKRNAFTTTPVSRTTTVVAPLIAPLIIPCLHILTVRSVIPLALNIIAVTNTVLPPSVAAPLAAFPPQHRGYTHQQTPARGHLPRAPAPGRGGRHGYNLRQRGPGGRTNRQLAMHADTLHQHSDQYHTSEHLAYDSNPPNDHYHTPSPSNNNSAFPAPPPPPPPPPPPE